MTFNMRVNVASDLGNAWPFRYPAAAQAIRASGADIVCTQEGKHPMLLDLEPLLPQYDWVGEGRQGGRKDEYCAVFYRKDIVRPVDRGHFSLSEFPDRLGYKSWNTNCPRMCTWVRFQAESGKEWVVFNTHLDHISTEAQIEGIRLIAGRIEEMRDRIGFPIILTGDFNCRPDSDVIAFLQETELTNAYTALPSGAASAGRTYHGFQGGAEGEPIDYIYVTPDIGISAVSVDRRRYEGRYPSDHYPVLTVLEV